MYFWRQLDIELTKLSNPHIYDEEENVQRGIRKLEDLPLFEIGKVNPELEKIFEIQHLLSQKIQMEIIPVLVVEQRQRPYFLSGRPRDTNE